MSLTWKIVSFTKRASFPGLSHTGQGLQVATQMTIAVGTPVARRPPHGSERAELAHSALALGVKAESHIGIGVRDAGGR